MTNRFYASGELTQERQYAVAECESTATSDIEALRSVDANIDGVFDANDDEWSNFEVMVTNADGSLEVKSLEDAKLDIISNILITNDTTNRPKIGWEIFEGYRVLMVNVEEDG
jgi:hypothetical protein